MKLLPALVAATAAKECTFTNWSSWTECSWLCGPNGTKERTRSIRLPRNGVCTENGQEPELKQVEACNRKCLNGGQMTNNNECRCKPSYMGMCCQIPVSASVDRCDKKLRAPDNGALKCGRAKPVIASALEEQTKVNGRTPLPYQWSCTFKCENGKGMHRATNDVIRCKAEGWDGVSFQQRSFNFDDYDDTKPTLPLPDCAQRNTVMGTQVNFGLTYNGSEERLPVGLTEIIANECDKKVRQAKAGLFFESDFEISAIKSRTRRDEEAVFVNGTEEVLPERNSFKVDLTFNISTRSERNTGWNSQELSKSLMRDCVGSVMADFEANLTVEDAEGFMPESMSPPEDMDSELWPNWDMEGSGCLPGSVLVGGNMQEKLECQACPRGTVFVSRAKGTRTMCRPCPAGSFMDKEGATHNDDGIEGECNACPSPAHMTNVFPAYTQDQCAKTSCFPNRTKFQVVFALDSSGSVTRPDYIRMREFAKSIVNRMCINGGEKQDGPKTCGQAGYVIYNTSPESFLKFKQVESAADFNRIDNYEYRGGAPRIGDLFEFIHDTYVDSSYTKTGIPLNVVLISDGQTQGDDREHMEKWTKILKKRVTKIITISKRSMFNENTLQLASTLDDRYSLYDYHELPSLVYPVMEQLCESVNIHKDNLKRKSLIRRNRRRQKNNQ